MPIPVPLVHTPPFVSPPHVRPELTLLRDGKPMRLFPIGAQASVNVPLRVVEDIDADVTLELVLAAPDGASGQVVIDFGMVVF